jgi:hypothetical protein
VWLLAAPFPAEVVVWDRILLEAKAVARLTQAHTPQALNGFAVSNRSEWFSTRHGTTETILRITTNSS